MKTYQQIWGAVKMKLGHSAQGFIRRSKTARHQTKNAALRESEERFRQAFECAGIGMALVDLDGRWLRVNRMFAEMLGYSMAEMQQMTFQSLTHPDDLAHGREECRRMMSEEIPYMRFEKRYRHRHGDYLWTRVTTSLVRSAQGEPQQFISQIENINDWKRAEHRLQLQAMVLDQIGDTVTVTDRDGKISYINRAQERQFGCSKEEVFGQSIEQFGGDSASSVPLHQIIQGIQRQGHFLREVVQHNPPKGEVLMEYRTNVVRDQSGKIVGLCEIGTNITERRRLEEQLRQSQKMEAVGQLAGGVSHDFNNILAAIMLQVDLLLAAPHLDQKVHASLEELQHNTRRAADLTRQLLMFSRRSAMVTKPLDLNDLVHNFLKMLRRLLSAQIQIEFHDQHGLPQINADPRMIEQVLMNLTLNARDAMPAGGRIVISTELVNVVTRQLVPHHEEGRPGQFVRLSVADTGGGMSAATMQRIFEPFFTTKEPGQGSGLGLATSYGIAKQHQGWIEAASELGKGSVFHVFLPPTSQPILATAAPAECPPKPGGGETILFVEDEPTVRRSVSQCLRQLGYHVIEARTGTEALELWPRHGHQVDLLFTDMIMPGNLTGLGLAEQLRKDKPDLPVIVSSGYNTKLNPSETATHAKICYLPKPFEAKVLGITVRNCLERSQA